MHFRLNNIFMCRLLVATCAVPVSWGALATLPVGQVACGQTPTRIEYATAPSWGKVPSAGGLQRVLRTPYEAAPVPAKLVAQVGQESSDVPAPPAFSAPAVPAEGAQSPSDLKLLDQSSDARRLPGTAGPEGSSRLGANQNALAPIQNRELTVKVQVVDVSAVGVGVGTLPPSAAAKRRVESTNVRGAVYKCVHWQPSSICHYPLYFEDAMLERHGQVRFGCLQPLASGVKFLATIPMLPYLYTLQPPCEPVYVLGHYRAGSCAPVLRSSLPWDRDAAVVEALTLAGFFWAAPL